MKNVFLLLLVIGLLVAGWMQRDKLSGITRRPGSTDEETDTASAAAPRAVATPHPAVQARAAAIRDYPGLGTNGSSMNKKFVALYEEAQAKDPELLSQADWPLTLAARAKAALAASQPPSALSTGATPAAATPSSGAWRFEGTALDRKPKPKR